METQVSESTLVGLESFSFVSSFTPQMLWLVLLAVLGIFAIISSILVYHWREYSLGGAVVRRMMTIYFTVSGAFILLLITVLLSITL